MTRSKNKKCVQDLQTRHQCSIHCEINIVAYGASKRRWAAQTTRDIPKGVQKASITKLNRKIHGGEVFRMHDARNNGKSDGYATQYYCYWPT